MGRLNVSDFFVAFACVRALGVVSRHEILWSPPVLIELIGVDFARDRSFQHYMYSFAPSVEF